MIKKINFTKMVASGNDFVVVEDNPKFKALGSKFLVRNICDRKFGAGADGLLLLARSGPGVIHMRIFNSDGSEAEMCGNGARCAALYFGVNRGIRIKTKAGIIESVIKKDNVKIKLTNPKDTKLDLSLKLSGRLIRVNFINTGVPHAVIFVEGLDKINIQDIGRQIRYHKQFSPKGTNVDFVEALDRDSLKIRTYERGVEDETLACGTGSVASALLYALSSKLQAIHKLNVHTKSGEILKVYFEKKGNIFNNVWLEGKAKIVYKGEYYV